MDLSRTYMAVYGPVHILPYDPQCHELFATQQNIHNLFRMIPFDDVPN
jgi:hypothetical protein